MENYFVNHCYYTSVSCEPGSFSSYGEKSRLFGTEALTENVPVCQQCPQGSYEGRVGSGMCTPCPEHYITMSTGAISADECKGMMHVDEPVSVNPACDRVNISMTIFLLLHVQLIHLSWTAPVLMSLRVWL